MGGTGGRGDISAARRRELSKVGLKINRKLSATKGSLEGGLGPTFKEAQERETITFSQVKRILRERFHSKFKTWKKKSETCTNNSFLAQGVVQITWVTHNR